MYQSCFESLEEIIRKNLQKRGMEKIRLEGELEKAASELLKGTTVFIVTGFVIRHTLTGETDGPIGAISLAGALESLGKKVVLITDIYSKDILQQGLKARGLKTAVEIILHEKAEEFSKQLLIKYCPSHIVAIERCGRAIDGKCYSMRGEDLSDIVPNTDVIFEKARKKGVVTIAVGDGGNEIGMGKVRADIIDSVYKGRKICAVFSTDFLIVAGVSNWGGHALTAALSLKTNKMLLHDVTAETHILKSIVNAGAVDGCTKKRELTVDGLSLGDNLGVLERLKKTVEFAMQT
jgi:hypothetical protein